MLPIVDGIVNMASKVLDKVVVDKDLKEKLNLEIAKMVQDGELAKLANEMKLSELLVQDKDSARKRESEIATSDKAPLINKIITPVLALSSLIISFIFFTLIVFNSNLIQGFNRDALMFILGILSSIDTAVIGYYFGSSVGSKEKDIVLQNNKK